MSFWVPETRLHPHKSTNGPFPSESSEASTDHPFLFLFLPHPQENSLCSQSIRGKLRRTGRTFLKHVERSFLDPEYSFVSVRRIPRTRFSKQTFVQLRTNYVHRTFIRFAGKGKKKKEKKERKKNHVAEVRPTKNGFNATLSSPDCFCIEMGSDESRFIASLTVRDKGSVHKPHLLRRKET